MFTHERSFAETFPFIMLVIRTVLALGIIGIASAILVTSCATTPTMAHATIIATDDTFAIPQDLHAGWVDITLVNHGHEAHQAQLARLNDGVTLAQFLAVVQSKGVDAALAMVTLHGGADGIMPGQQQEVMLDLPAGQYVALCFMPDAHGTPHVAKGILTSFIVGKAVGNAQVPKADVAVTLQDFAILLPTNLSAGDHTFQVTNKGPQPHEMQFVKLNAGKTMHDVMQAMGQNGTMPGVMAGGLGTLMPGTTGYAKLHLTAGTYVVVCMVPDNHTGQPHMMLGMMTQVTVH